MDDACKLIVIAALRHFLSSDKISTPVSSTDLLSLVVAFTPPAGLVSGQTLPRLRLTDLARFEGILESLCTTWEDGTIRCTRENDELIVLELSLTPAAISAANRKRKRVVDEEADSAAGSDEYGTPGQDDNPAAAATPLSALNKEQREVFTLIQKSTAKGKLLAERFRSSDDNFEPICRYITKEDCTKARRTSATPPDRPVGICDGIHFKPLIRAHTDPALGHCSYLNTCYSEPTYAHSPSIPPFPGSTYQHPPGVRGPSSLPSGLGAGGRGKEKAPCRYLHYEVDWEPGDGTLADKKGKETMQQVSHKLPIGLGPTGEITDLRPPQWIQCDIRRFDYSVLGKFHVIMADPPWDIHMSLPYGTMTDDEMRAMPIPMLQDEGLLFLWVTGRAMEVGRECMRHWGYTRIDEVVWVKTNQLQRVIRTGRTGHWLNHTKEHMLVGVKTNLDGDGNLKIPTWVNRGLDTDVIVSEVRETSRKPDEAYGLIERMCPGGRKVEIFGRKHNTRPGWLTLGNQVGNEDQICESDLAARIKAKYPDRRINFIA
ncbi:MT-A70-domain-containing protein [Cylindrobasidium torrendii FP15055 ss-10]|uniref:mRNA m(6)A methyltransferase n=1 Tax=Cylindrobasidium torrendii FP15055 ss-10 TaxID=1314674 RepID=A0A0D7BTF4_9AGAR|nr:MT-A70-domain-containing protein [Cylindrobasidium torrendii FP15055 ss-10]